MLRDGSPFARVSPRAGGVWLGVARDVYVHYVDSDAYGSGTFESYLHAHLREMGVFDLSTLSGTAKTAARKANQTFILEHSARRCAHASCRWPWPGS